MVPESWDVNLLQDNVRQKMNVDAFSDGCTEWTKDMFYLNRIFRDKDKAYHFSDDDANKAS